jgi:hypothetical protein
MDLDVPSTKNPLNPLSNIAGNMRQYGQQYHRFNFALPTELMLTVATNLGDGSYLAFSLINAWTAWKKSSSSPSRGLSSR